MEIIRVHSAGLCRRNHHLQISKVNLARLTALGAALADASGAVYRSFPWRTKEDPYAIAVAEILLQKTRAAKVAEHFEPLLSSFPTPSLLAGASFDDLVSRLKPLGLASKRATLLLMFGRAMVECGSSHLKMGLPVPGLGDYGRRAVMCFAFGLAVGIVDSNVRRLLGRALGLKTHCANYYQDLADRLALIAVDPKRVNYALLDVAAAYCRPTPLCATCPLNRSCAVGIKATATGPTTLCSE